MDNECYTYPSNKGKVVICRNTERPALWDLWINGKLLRAAYYDSAEEAARRTYERDFGDEELNKLYLGLRVLPDLHHWHHDSYAAAIGRRFAC